MMPSNFEIEYDRMMAQALAGSSAERRRKLLEKEQPGKMMLANVWWPAVGNLVHLHPEHECADMKGGTRFADFAYLPPQSFRLIVEIDGFGPHWRDVSRWKFADDLQRQNHLLIEGWRLLRFAFDDINDKPRRCQQSLLMGLAKWGGMLQTGGDHDMNVYERAILQVMQERMVDMSANDAAAILGIHKQTAITNLQSLVDKQLLHPHVSKKGRLMKYSLKLFTTP